jgi:1-acyl-sn-glycerol-3-phosphate acyltransferase
MSLPSVEPGLVRWRRRAVTLPAVYLLALVVVVITPAALVAALVVDVLRPRHMTATRTVAFLAWYILGEAIFLGICLAQWLAARGWTRDGAERLGRWTQRLGNAWGAYLQAGGRLWFGISIEIEQLELARPGRPALVFPRHASLGDTVLSPIYLGRAAGLRLRYVAKRELLFDPAFDVIGQRIGSLFVRRGSTHAAEEIDTVGAMAEALEPGDALIIYPEGTRFSEAKRQRALERAGRLEPELQAIARGLRHVLPPRLGGPLALLERNRAADVIFCAHAGYEGAATMADLFSGRAIGLRIVVSFRRVPYEAIPRSRAEQAAWLFAEWARMDEWVHRRLSAEPAAETVRPGGAPHAHVPPA